MMRYISDIMCYIKNLEEDGCPSKKKKIFGQSSFLMNAIHIVFP